MLLLLSLLHTYLSLLLHTYRGDIIKVLRSRIAEDSTDFVDLVLEVCAWEDGRAACVVIIVVIIVFEN